MPRFIVKQKNKKWGIWTTISDGFLEEDLTLEEAVESFYDERIRDLESQLAWAKFRRQEFLNKSENLEVMEMYYFKNFYDENGRVPEYPPEE